MGTAPAFVCAKSRVGILGAVLLLGACVSDRDRSNVVSTEGCRTETRRAFQTAGPKSVGTVVTRRVRVCHPAGASFERASPDR